MSASEKGPNAGAKPDDDSRFDVPLRVQAAVYGVGLFSTTIFYITAVIVPLHAYSMNPSPLAFGLVFSAAHVLPLFFSIHAGALIDRIGARRVMLAMTTLGAVTPLFYPLAPNVWVLIMLQMFLGFAESIGWLGAQTMIGQYMHGRTTYAGRLSFIIRIGQLAAPPMAGFAWDMTGPWGAFILMSVWASGAVVSALMLPPKEPSGSTAHLLPGRYARFRGLLPNPADYVTAFRLLARPAVVVIVLLSSMLHLGNTVQSSFYVAWLNEIGLTGTAIGFISPFAAIGAALFSLASAPLTRYVPGLWIVLFSLWTGIIMICITPLLGAYALLVLASFIRAGSNGLAQPLIITLVLGGAGRANLGKATGLRGTANRIASVIGPAAMGLVAQWVGLENSFYVAGVFISAMMLAMAIYLWKHPEVARSGEL
ncbi:MAG: MFS transporter [Beijerinckiaceae bacterium]